MKTAAFLAGVVAMLTAASLNARLNDERKTPAAPAGKFDPAKFYDTKLTLQRYLDGKPLGEPLTVQGHYRPASGMRKNGTTSVPEVWKLLNPHPELTKGDTLTDGKKTWAVTAIQHESAGRNQRIEVCYVREIATAVKPATKTKK